MMAVQALVGVLREMNELHQELIGLADEKKDAIIANRVDRLNQIVNKEAKLVRRIAELDQKRAEEIGQFLMRKGYRPNPNITMNEVAKLLFRPEDKQELHQVQNELADTIKQLKAKNELNQSLLEQSLQYINFSLDLMTGGSGEDVTYSQPGHQAYGNARPGLFDTRA